MQQISLKCPDCLQTIKESHVKKHIQHCNKYSAFILKHSAEMKKLANLDYLKFLMVELDLAKQELQYNITNFKDQQPTIIPKSNTSKNNQPIIISKNATQILDQLIHCKNCNQILNNQNFQQLIYADQCLDIFCKECMVSYIESEFVHLDGVLPCLLPSCKATIPTEQIKSIIGSQKFQKLNEDIVRKSFDMVICCKCKHSYEFVAGNPRDAPKKDQKGRQLTDQQKNDYSKNRFQCLNPTCKSQQCKLCKASPYHLGLTCEQNNANKLAKKCRYCGDILKPGYRSNIGIKSFDDICNKAECELNTKQACSKIHKCGHSCYGYINQKNCLPCLNEKCADKNKEQLLSQNQNQYCKICYIEGLSANPCVRTKCGHIFHYKCLAKRLEMRWLTARIFLNFCLCPLCNQWIQFPSDCPLSTKLNSFKQLNQQIKQKSLLRLKFQKADKDEKLLDKDSIYYNNPQKYAMAIYAYFQCFQCKKPYFGGRKNCAEVMNGQSQQQYKKQQLVCPKCCPINVNSCNKHGKQFIEYKCKFCCSVAQWFCWGNTHFCDECHKKQCNGQYVSKIPKDKLPKCQGPGKCPIGGNHVQNGQQKSIGCALCRDFKNGIQQF